ncbi:hypothetical protein [Nonomuraea sp. NPDC003214]
MTERPRPAVRLPAGTTAEQAHRATMPSALAALGEGLCPACAADLQPAEGDSHSEPTGRPWLHCPACACYWQADHDKSEVTWEAAWFWAGIDPFNP